MAYTTIAISGQIAAGTTTAAKNVAENLNLKFESAGEFFRKYMLQNSIPLWDKSKIPDELDEQIDTKLTNLAKQGGYVIDGHYIGYFTRNMSNVLRVLLTCADWERIRRAMSRNQLHQENMEDIEKREQGLDAKFRKLYAPEENYLDPKFFNLVIDTTKISPRLVAEKIIAAFQGTTTLKLT